MIKADSKEIANLIRLANVARGHLEAARVLIEELTEKGADLLHGKAEEKGSESPGG